MNYRTFFILSILIALANHTTRALPGSPDTFKRTGSIGTVSDPAQSAESEVDPERISTVTTEFSDIFDLDLKEHSGSDEKEDGAEEIKDIAEEYKKLYGNKKIPLCLQAPSDVDDDDSSFYDPSTVNFQNHEHIIFHRLKQAPREDQGKDMSKSVPINIIQSKNENRWPSYVPQSNMQNCRSYLDGLGNEVATSSELPRPRKNMDREREALSLYAHNEHSFHDSIVEINNGKYTFAGQRRRHWSSSMPNPKQTKSGFNFSSRIDENESQ